MKEKRITAELRTDNPAGTSELVLIGQPIIFDKPTTINSPFGSYTEIIKREALIGCDMSDIRLLYDHNTGRLPLARTPRTMQFEITPAGVNMRAVLPDTEEGRSVYTAVQRGDLSGMSFSFKVPPGGDTYDAATNIRVINQIERCYEFSLCVFPAYPETSVEARSAITEAKQRAAQIEQAKSKINQILGGK